MQLGGVPYKILDSQHTKVARGGAIVRAKLRNLLDGSVRQETFKGNDKLEPANVQKIDMQYLYNDGGRLLLMNSQNYEQFTIAAADVGNGANFIAEGSNVIALVFNAKVIGLDIPAKMILKITQTEPGIQGDTAKAALKPAVLESGATIQVPLFIKSGDRVKVDTRSGSYIERA